MVNICIFLFKYALYLLVVEVVEEFDGEAVDLGQFEKMAQVVDVGAGHIGWAVVDDIFPYDCYLASGGEVPR